MDKRGHGQIRQRIDARGRRVKRVERVSALGKKRIGKFTSTRPRYSSYQVVSSIPGKEELLFLTVTLCRYDLSRFGDNNAQGIAYVRSICKIGESVSMVEDVGAMATVAVAGHELAHR